MVSTDQDWYFRLKRLSYVHILPLFANYCTGNSKYLPRLISEFPFQDDHRAFRRQLEDKRPVVESNLLSGRQYIANEPPLSDTSDTEGKWRHLLAEWWSCVVVVHICFKRWRCNMFYFLYKSIFKYCIRNILTTCLLHIKSRYKEMNNNYTLHVFYKIDFIN